MKVTLKKVEKIAPGNPFLSDLFNMGQPIGKDLMLMFKNHPDEDCHYLILVDTKTGERVRIDKPPLINQKLFNLDDFRSK